MIRTLIVENREGKEIELRIGWKYDKKSETCHAHHLTHDINQDAQGIIDDLKAEGYDYTLIGELIPS